MSSKFFINISKQAETELENIYQYIVQVFCAAGTAKKIVDKITKGIGRLSDMPRSAPPFTNSKITAKDNVHKLVVEQYTVYYAIYDDTQEIIILHILHSAQDHASKI